VAERPSIEARLWHRLLAATRGMGPSERLASIGAVAVYGSLLLPWYRSPVGNDLVQTGSGAFNFATAGLLLTMGAVLYLAVEVGGGYRPPRPLSIGTLMILGGAWSALIVIYMMVDTPAFHLAGINDDYDITYGIFIALGGAVATVVAGVRRRAREIIARHSRMRREAEKAGAPRQAPSARQGPNG
jgi:hypothetical protein